MAKKIINKRCPLVSECGRGKCMFEGKELGCDYYYNNAAGDSVIPDQEECRRLEDAKFLKAQEEQMFAEIEVENRASEIAIEINIIKRDTAEMFGRNSIKIGQRLKEVKEMLPHGEWESWLRVNVDYSITTAQRFMRLADAYAGQLAAGDEDVAELFASMLPSKALVLAQLTPAQRKEFVQENDVDQMSVRKLEEAVKAKEAAERRAAEAESAAADAEKAREDLQGRLEELDKQLLKAKAVGEISPEERAEIEKQAQKAADEAAAKKIDSAKKQAEKALDKARKEGEEALKNAKTEYEEAVKTAVEQAKAEAERETAARVAELEERIRSQAALASPFRVRFGESLEALKSAYARMVLVVEEAEREDPAEGELLRKMISQIVSLLGA